jgi:acetyltransferase-like isoleucine patch superfamily enzyme
MARETVGTTARITFKTWFMQKILGFNHAAYWPVSHLSTVTHPTRVRTGIGTAPGLSPGCYVQAANGIEIGDYTLVAPNVGIISSNHSVTNLRAHEPAPPIVIGTYCWLGMNAVILPGVRLGDHTVVGANSVVRDSFPDGYCVLAGAPARVVKQLDPDAVQKPENEHRYVGYHALGTRSKEDLFAELGVRAFS